MRLLERKPPVFTPFEAKVMSLRDSGLTTGEIAKALGCATCQVGRAQEYARAKTALWRLQDAKRKGRATSLFLARRGVTHIPIG